MKNRNVEAAESYIKGLKRKDLSNVPLASDVIFEGPLSPDKLHGVESLIEFSVRRLTHRQRCPHQAAHRGWRACLCALGT